MNAYASTRMLILGIVLLVTMSSEAQTNISRFAMSLMTEHDAMFAEKQRWADAEAAARVTNGFRSYPLNPLSKPDSSEQVTAVPVAGWLAKGRLPDRHCVAGRQRLRMLCDAKSVMLPPKLASQLQQDDEPAIIELYKQETELTNKVALTWALAVIGGDAGAKALMGTLNADYQNRKLSQAEWLVVRDTMRSLGLIARRSEVAYQFLVLAAEESYWSANRKWRAQEQKEEDYSKLRFAGMAILGMGASVHPGVLERLQELKDSDSALTRHAPGSIATAAFYYDFGLRVGDQAVVQSILSGNSFEEYQQWTKTDNGKMWRDWAFAKMANKPVP